MSLFRIAQAQVNPTVGYLDRNLDLVLQGLESARQAGAGLVCFPELVLCGYPPEDLLIKPRFLEDTLKALRKASRAARGIIAVVGFAEPGEEVVYNSAAVLAGGDVAAVYRKIELPNYGVFDEKRYFTPGGRALCLDLCGVGFMLTICEDVWVPDNLVLDQTRRAGAGVVLNISASPFHAGKLSLRHETMARFARAAGALVCHTNLLGGQDELVFDGETCIMDARGELVASCPRFREGLLITDLELAPGEPRHGHPDIDRLALSLPAPPRGAARPAARSPELEGLEEIHQALILGTRDYITKNGFKKTVLGLSGGIDSALTAALAVEALGRDNVVGVTMPSRYTSGETRSDAELLASNLGIRLITLPVGRILEAYLEELAPAMDGDASGITEENLQARIRGNLLMGLSNRFGWLVLTTGNKSENAVGYCTLYGDMAGGFAVIKDVPKTLVFQLAGHVNRRAGREIIPQTTIDRPPSAELRPDQKDTDSLPPYEVLDPILQAYVEKDLVLDQIVALGYDPDLVKRVVRMVDMNEYKRRQAPPGVKITPKAFGKDRRLPITNHYQPGWD